MSRKIRAKKSTTKPSISDQIIKELKSITDKIQGITDGCREANVALAKVKEVKILK